MPAQRGVRTAGWPIPVETRSYETLRLHFGRDRALFETDGPLPDGAAALVGVRAAGECVFFEADRGRLCSIHRELGPANLPEACRQFPRVVLRDSRGLLISLSHYCPTAAALLLDPAPVTIVRAPESLALDGRAEGLDARAALPPLLRPGMLMDPDGYATWESRGLETLGRDDLSASQALAAISSATLKIQGWRPGGPPLREAVNREFDVASAPETRRRFGSGYRPIPAGARGGPAGIKDHRCTAGYAESWKQVVPWGPQVDRAVRAWTCRHGCSATGLLTTVRGCTRLSRYLRVSHAVVKVEAVRHHVSLSGGASPSPWQTVIEAFRNADLLLVHLCDPKDLSRSAVVTTSALERFLRYVTINTRADEASSSCPSTSGQLVLLRLLVNELTALGLSARHDGRARLRHGDDSGHDREASCAGGRVHRSRRHVAGNAGGTTFGPIVHRNYDGRDLILPDDPAAALRPADDPVLAAHVGQDIVTALGLTLLGADDKAGVAAIVTAAEDLVQHPEIPHGTVRIGFTPDEEIGRGANHFDVGRFGAARADTLDGGSAGELEWESFSADAMTVTFKGFNTHPGYAKGRMVNAIKLAAEFIGRLPRRPAVSRDDCRTTRGTRTRTSWMHRWIARQ